MAGAGGAAADEITTLLDGYDVRSGGRTGIKDLLARIRVASDAKNRELISLTARVAKLNGVNARGFAQVATLQANDKRHGQRLIDKLWKELKSQDDKLAKITALVDAYEVRLIGNTCAYLGISNSAKNEIKALLARIRVASDAQKKELDAAKAAKCEYQDKDSIEALLDSYDVGVGGRTELSTVLARIRVASIAQKKELDASVVKCNALQEELQALKADAPKQIVRVKKEQEEQEERVEEVGEKKSRAMDGRAIYRPSTPPAARSGAAGGVAGSGASGGVATRANPICMQFRSSKYTPTPSEAKVCALHKEWLETQCRYCADGTCIFKQLTTLPLSLSTYTSRTIPDCGVTKH